MEDQMKELIAEMNHRVRNLETRMSSLEERMYSMEKQLGEVKKRLVKLENDELQMKTPQETKILPGLNTIENGYTGSNKRYIADKIEQMETDMGILKMAVLNGSRRRSRRKA